MLKAKKNKQIHRQVVDVTGYEPNICYVGNAMVRRSRRELAKLRSAAGETDAAIIPTEAPEQEDSRRGTMIDGQAPLKGMSILDTKLFKQNESLVRPSLRPHDLKLNQTQRHAKLGHFGHHKNCVYCQQVKSRPRQVYKNPGDWNVSDLGTKPTDTPTTQRLVPIICGQAELPIPAGQKILFGPVDKPVRRESTNLAVALKSMTNTEA